jgi:hypothetical protein
MTTTSTTATKAAATVASTRLPTRPSTRPPRRRAGRLARRLLRRLAIHLLCGAFAAVTGGAWCLAPGGPYDDETAVTAPAVLLGIGAALAAARCARRRRDAAGRLSTQDGDVR